MNFYNPCLQNIPRDFEISTENLLSENCLQVESSNGVAGSGEFVDEVSAANFLEKISENPVSKTKSAGTISLRNAFICSEAHVLLAAVIL